MYSPRRHAARGDLRDDGQPEEIFEMTAGEATDTGSSDLLSGDESAGELAPGDALIEAEAVIDSDYEDESPPPKPAARRGKRKRAET